MSGEALLGCVDAPDVGCWRKFGLALALGFVDDALDPTEGVIARPENLTTDIDTDEAIADGPDVKLGALVVGLELICQEEVQHLRGEPSKQTAHRYRK